MGTATTAAQAQTSPAAAPTVASVGSGLAPVTARQVSVALPDDTKKPVAGSTTTVKISGVSGETQDPGFEVW